MVRSELKRQAKDSLKGRWGTAILALFIVFLVTVIMQLPRVIPIVQSLVQNNNYHQFAQMNTAELMKFYVNSNSMLYDSMVMLLSLLISTTLTAGLYTLYLNISNNVQCGASTVFSQIKRAFKFFMLFLYVGIKTILWSLLFIIPGIIAAYNYSLAIFIMIENPDLSIVECVNRSKKLMKGNKWELFVLELSFIGWTILGALTLCIGFLWLEPYIYVTMCNFYKGLKEQAEGEPASAELNA